MPPLDSKTPSARIVFAARTHFFLHGFRRVTMDDLAKELGMSKKSVYACFPSKIALLKAVLIDKFDRVESDLQHITEDCSDVPTTLHRLLACMQRHTAEIQPPFVRDIGRESPALFALIQERRRKVIQRYFGKLFDKGRRAGMIRTDLPSKLIIEILLGATEAIMNPAKITALKLTPKSGFSAIITIVLEGALTQTGRTRP